MSQARFSLVPAAYLLLVREPAGVPQVLLQLRRGTGYMDGFWASGAAGHVEAGESVVQAALREAAEELGVGIEPGDLVALTAMHRCQAGGPPVEQRVDFFFWSRRWQGEPTVREPAKSAGLEWFPLTALPDPVVPHELAVLRLLRAQLAGQGPVPAVVTFDSTKQVPAPRLGADQSHA